MMISVRPLDITSDADLEQYDVVRSACDEERFGGSEKPSVARTRARLASDPFFTCGFWVAEIEEIEGGTSIIGIAGTAVPLTENLDQVFVHISVHPAHRGNGAATALVEGALIPELRQIGRPIVAGFGDVSLDADLEDPSLPATRIAARLGAIRVSAATSQALDLPLDAETLEELEARAEEKIGEYRIQTFDGEIPQEHLESYGSLLRQLDLDDPHEDFQVEAGDYPPERLRRMESQARDAGTRPLIAVAIAPDGTFVGNSVIDVHDSPGTTIAHQENTLVMPEHRGHRLGLALKVRNQRRLQEAFPQLRRLITWNSRTNAAMIAVNDQLGFRPCRRGIAFQGTFAG